MKRCGPFHRSARRTSASLTRPSGRQSGTSKPSPDAAVPRGYLHRVSWFSSRERVRDLQSCCALKSLNIRCVQAPTAARTRLSGELNALIVPGHPDALWQQRPNAREARVTGGLLGFSSRPAESLRVPCSAQAPESLPLSMSGTLRSVATRLTYGTQ